jgi:hypothetical protein
MDTSDPIARTFVDRSHDLERRLQALHALVEGDQTTAMQLVLEVGRRADESEAMLKAVGSALASLSYKGLAVTEFDTRDLTGSSYEAFCEWKPPDG